MSRVLELRELARAGDDEIRLLVASEFALMPDTYELRLEAAGLLADEVADTFAVEAEILDEDAIDELAYQVGF